MNNADTAPIGIRAKSLADRDSGQSSSAKAWTRFVRTSLLASAAAVGISSGVHSETALADSNPIDSSKSDVASKSLADSIREALAEGDRLARSKKFNEAVSVYNHAIEHALSQTDAESQLSQILTNAARDAKGFKDPQSASARLAGGLSMANAHLNFKPTIEAPLPENFPGPSALDQIVIKLYPAYRRAITSMNASSNRQRNSAFGKLFRHIKKNRIAMTAPVEVEYEINPNTGAQATTMSFLYRSVRQGAAENRQPVKVEDIAPQQFVSVAVRGSYSIERFESARQRLTRWLQKNDSYQAIGEPRYLMYNSPFIAPWSKYGEVQIPVKKVVDEPDQATVE